MRTDVSGPSDKFRHRHSHGVAALIAKIHRAKQQGAPAVEIWGTGKPRREFLYVDDLADAVVFLMRHYSAEPHVNIGAGKDLTIDEFAALIAEIVGFRGGFTHDRERPDGAPRKLLDVGRINALGWTAPTS